jgi:hypothetical protein
MHDQTALLDGDYKSFGQLVALALLNGAGGPHILSPCLANFLLGTEENSNIEDLIMELPKENQDIKDKLNLLNECKQPELWKEALMNFDERFDFGINRAPVPFNEKDTVITSSVKHIMISSVAEENYSFKEGLSSFGVYDILRQHPEEAFKELTFVEITVEDV